MFTTVQSGFCAIKSRTSSSNTSVRAITPVLMVESFSALVKSQSSFSTISIAFAS